MYFNYKSTPAFDTDCLSRGELNENSFQLSSSPTDHQHQHNKTTITIMCVR